MTDMLEKIARAMVAAEKDEWDLPAEKWSVQALEDHGLMGLARAALLAMREPDPDAEKYATAGGWLEVEGGFESLLHDYIDHILGQAV